jgi:hypothetical protein
MATTTSPRKKREEEEKGCFFPCSSWLPSYLYRLCITCVSPSMLGVVSTPPHCFEISNCLNCSTIPTNIHCHRLTNLHTLSDRAMLKT